MPGVLDAAPSRVLDDAPPAAAAPVTYRRFDDVPALRAHIYHHVLEEAKRLPPLSFKGVTLKLDNVAYEDPEEISLAKEKQAFLTGQTLTRRLRGDWTLEDDATGKALDHKRSTVAAVPYVTRHGTFVLNGSHYSLANQMRLKPGIYVRQKQSGDYEAHVNTLPGRGLSHRYYLDPETSVFRLNVGQASMPLIPLLEALGAKPRDMQEAWGAAVHRANEAKNDPRVLDKLYQKLVRYPGEEQATAEGRKQKVVESFLRMGLDPEISRRTLGSPHASLTAPAILDTTKKLLAVSRGEAAEDDRDHLANQIFLGPEDLLAERIRTGGRTLRPYLWRAFLKKNLDPLPAGALTKHLHGAITASGLGQSLDEVGPLDVLDQLTRVTRLGMGGLPSTTAIPDASRNVGSSQLGYIDPVRTPESEAAGVDLRFASGALKGSDGRVYAHYRDAKTGEGKLLSPVDVADKVIAFPAEMERGTKWIRLLDRGKIRYGRRDEAELVAPNFESSFNQLANLVPLKSGIKPQRVAMGSRMLAQALSLTNAEAPLVQTEHAEQPGRSYDQALGAQAGAVFSRHAGRVLAVTPEEIRLRDPQTGEAHSYPLYNNYALNRKSLLHNEPSVRPGDTVQPGQLLARSNFTDAQGTAAPGLNARVGYLADGHNFEDAFSISESFARRQESEQMYPHEQPWEENIKRGKKAFLGLFPAAFNRAQMDKLDEHGVVKPGQTVEHGDPLVLVARERPLSHKQLSRGKGTAHRDGTLTWEHETPGTVADTAITEKGATVTVKSRTPTRLSDKISGVLGDKGVVGKIWPDEQMPRGADGRPFEVLINPLGTITRCFDEATELLTRRGWTAIARVRPSDILLCFDPEQDLLIWHFQTSPLFVQEVKKKLVGVGNIHVDFLVTSGHSVAFLREPPIPGVKPLWEFAPVQKLIDKEIWLPAPQKPETIYRRRGYDGIRAVPVRQQDWFEQFYEGKVYCPSVPTGFVACRRYGKQVCLGNTNPAQVPLAVLGKIAAQRGQPYLLPKFDDLSELARFAQDEAQKHGVSDTETVTDPVSGRKIPGILTGVRYLLKLHHLSESKSHSRGLGSYTAEGAPAKGSDEGGRAKRVALQDLNALLSHGATNVVRDSALVGGQENFDLWAAFLRGIAPPEPKTPLVNEKFFEMLRAAGIHPLRQGGQIRAHALTDRDIDERAEGRTLKNAETVDWAEGKLRPVAGGLFDEGLTGGHGGRRWAALPLAERLPSPVFEEPIKKLLGLTQNRFEGVLAGREKVGDATGPAALYQAIDQIDLPKAIARERQTLATGRRTARDEAARRLGYLKGAAASGIHPREWFWSKVPVLPPVFRPVSVMGGGKGVPLVADQNYLYREIHDANDALGQLQGQVGDLGQERLNLYQAVKAAVGLGDPVQPKNRERGVKGLLEHVFGSSGKFSLLQRKILSHTVDTVGRGMITPDPDLDIDSLGIPEKEAWKVYQPFVIHRLAKGGVPPGEAVRLVEEKGERARKALLEVMDERPVIMNRAPVLHRYGEMAFWPRLEQGNTVRINPNIVKGFGADFDGDQVNYRVPFGEDAVRDTVEKMLPSRNLRSVKSFKADVYLPWNEYAGGLYHASTAEAKGPEHVFATWKDARAAYERGEIHADTKVAVLHPDS